MKAAVAEQWGGPEVLSVQEVEDPHAGAGQVRVRVSDVSLNLADLMAISSPQIATMFGLELPAGIGNDFAGVVDEVGEGVTDFVVGDRVFGGARSRAAAQYIVVTPKTQDDPRGLNVDELYHTPSGVSDQDASTIQTAGLTADAAVSALNLTPEDTVLIGGAAGGVGAYTIQLAKLAGARVIGTGSESTAGFLADLGAEPVTYGEDLADQIAAVAPDGITAVIDLHGAETAQLGIDLGLPKDRIVAVANHDPAFAETITTTGSLQAPADGSTCLAHLIEKGDLAVPIDSTFPVEDIQAASTRLLQRHSHGKIVVTA